MTLRIAGLQLGFALSATASASAQTCNLTWQLIGPLGVFGDSGTALIEHDIDGDGPMGPVLVSAGNQGNTPKWWDGSAWQELTSASPAARILECDALGATAFDFDGPGNEPASLVLCGWFRMSDGTTYSVIRWDGLRWSALLDSNRVESVIAFDPDEDGPDPERLFALGSYFDLPSGTQRGVVMWNGAEWVGTGFPTTWVIPSIWGGRFGRFDFDGPGPLPAELVIAGGFNTFLSGPRRGGVARWQVGAWTFDGVGIPQFHMNRDFIDALAEYDFDGDGPLPPRLVAAGTRSETDIPAAWIAYLDGSTWVPLAVPVSGAGFIFDLEVLDADGDGPEPERLYAAGEFIMHRYVGPGWQQVTSPRTMLSGYEMLPTVWNGRPSLVVGGVLNATGLPRTVAVLRGCGPDCIGDFDENRTVNLADLALLLANFGSNESSTDL
ncbi:MAG: hypothetical protein ACKVS9_16785, partial [Phycisphaerae bacterium]